jgi:hypothetical protein
LRALPFETRIEILQLVARSDEPYKDESGEEYIDIAIRVVEKAGEHGITLDDINHFIDFIVDANAEETRKVLFTGTSTEEERRQAGAAFIAAISGLVREGRLTGPDIQERLSVAGEIQAGAA